MKFFLGLLLAAGVRAAQLDRVRLPRDTTTLDVKVEVVGNSNLKASITNTGSKPIRLMKAGSLLDDKAIEKAEIYSGTDQITFQGIRLALMQSNLPDTAFETLEVGQTVENEWDPAAVHDLSSGGNLDFVIRGSFLTAEADSTEVTDEIPFSCTVTTNVDGATAAKVRRAFVDNIKAKRSVVQDDCTGQDGQAQHAALTTCSRLATAAQQAAQNGSGQRMIEYFDSDSTSVRQQVAQVYGDIAVECANNNEGISTQYCTDVLSNCDDSIGILAYTVPSMDLMVSCGIYFSQLPALENACNGQDQATTTLHEVTHIESIAGTLDLAYGYRLISRLSTEEALKNADTYTLFANAVEVGC